MFERLRERVTTWRNYRETVRQLNWLDPHMLADAGIERNQIKACAAGKCETPAG